MSSLPSEWEIKPLSELVDKIIDYRGKTPKKLGLDWSKNGKYRALSAKTVKTGGLVNEQQINLGDEELYNKWMKDEIQFNDILLTSEAPMGEVLIWKSEEKIILSQRLFAIRIKENVSPDYIYYYFISKRFQAELLARASGTTVIGIKQAELLKTKVVLPSYEEQKIIANVLLSCDKKIELLQEQNKVLETIALECFKEWFIKNKKDNWEQKRLGDFISVKHGFAFKGSHISLEENDNILVTPGNFKIGGGFKNSKFKYYQSSNFPNEYILKEDDLIVTMTDLSKEGDTLGFPALVPKSDKKYLHNQRIGKVIINGVDKYFLYYLMRTREYQKYIVGSASGTSVRHTSPSSISNYKFLLPDEKLINQFSTLSESILNKIKNNTLQIQTISNMKNVLLPKLINGEKRVSL